MPSKFYFVDYMRDALEQDFSRLVGQSIVMWLILIGYVLLSWVLGAPLLWKRKLGGLSVAPNDMM